MTANPSVHTPEQSTADAGGAPGYIGIDDCQPRGVYVVDARNLRVAVYDGDEGFIGIRTKFGDRYLSTEYHWDQGPPFGTVRPTRLVMVLPDDIELRATEPTTCHHCGDRVEFRPDQVGGTGTWHHLGVGTCSEVLPVVHTYQPLFEHLERCEQLHLDRAPTEGWRRDR